MDKITGVVPGSEVTQKRDCLSRLAADHRM